MSIKTTNWTDQAACKGKDSSIFFPASNDYATYRLAMSICNSCPVKDTCLQENLSETDGIWGATSGNERERLRKQNRQRTKACQWCGASFMPANFQKQMCSEECRNAARRHTYAKHRQNVSVKG